MATEREQANIRIREGTQLHEEWSEFKTDYASNADAARAALRSALIDDEDEETLTPFIAGSVVSIVSIITTQSYLLYGWTAAAGVLSVGLSAYILAYLGAVAYRRVADESD